MMTSRRNLTRRPRRSCTPLSACYSAGRNRRLHGGIYTNVPFSHFPYLVTRILFVSLTAWEKAGRSWTEFAKAPAGTGPFKITKVTPRVSVEMARNPDYWDHDRIPKLDRMIVMPMPEANTRVAALRSGQVDWIEV